MTSAIASGATQRFGSAFGISTLFRGVSIVPGRTQFTLIPERRSSAALLSVKRTVTLVEALYAAELAAPASAARAATLTILPAPCLSIDGTTARLGTSAPRVQGEHEVPRFQRRLVDGLAGAIASNGVCQDVDASEALEHRRDEARNGRLVGDFYSIREQRGPASKAFGEPGRQATYDPVHQDKARPRRSEGTGRCSSQAPGGAGNDDDGIREVDQHVVSPSGAVESACVLLRDSATTARVKPLSRATSRFDTAGALP